MKRKPQRPRLEHTVSSNLFGTLSEGFAVIRVYNADAMEIKDAKRLHAFLGKAIAYLESKRGRKG